jgi:ribosomal protein S18 acetylase RimI-like enzyme
MAPDVSLRPARDEDEALLYRVFASTREAELAPLGLDEGQKTTLLRMQYTAQHQHYRAAFPGAEYLVVLRAGQPVGRYYLYRGPDEFRVLDIALLPEHRRAGIGGALLGALLAEADLAGRPVRLHVERNNPAIRLYERLGFKCIGDTGVYFHLERPEPLPRQADERAAEPAPGAHPE